MAEERLEQRKLAAVRSTVRSPTVARLAIRSSRSSPALSTCRAFPAGSRIGEADNRVDGLRTRQERVLARVRKLDAAPNNGNQ
jgi:hypothetical protein